ncbi:hypothetical protein [Psychrobacillus psychrotolerans]|uniref:hypothetical protein n=1 Tax=Psychrobacillus psychrotolerans TaxID=126156 RepID=UPI003B014F72
MSLRDIFVEIGMDIDDGPLQDMIAEIDNLMDSISNSNIDDLEHDLQNMDQQVNNADNSMSGFKKTLLGIGGIIAGLGLGKAMIDFGKGAIEASATANAMNAQFEQVFDGMVEHSTQSLNQIAKDTGMLSNRLKGSFTQMAAFAKTTGMDTAGSLALTERATLAAADSAAFYDRSIEEVAESIQSFLKGNYENDAALGISATETTRNAMANELFGKSFKKLSESQKQLSLLAMVEEGNKLSGAFGQAARESNSFENQMGNLRQVWEDLKAKFGQPILNPFVSGLAIAVEKIASFDPQPIIDGATNMALKAIEFGQSVKEHWDPIKETLIGLGTAVLTFKGIMLGLSVINTVTTATALWAAGNRVAALSMLGLNATMLANPITWVVLGIAALIAIGVLLYRNWDTVKVKAGELWAKTKEVFGNIFNWGKEKIQPVTDFFRGLGDKFNDFKNAISNFKLPKWVTTIGSTIGNAASKVGNLVNGSHATGLGRVPYDGYMAELHKDEAILTAEQSNALRSSGMLKGDGVAPSLSLGQDYEPLQGSPSSSTTTTNNSNSSVQAPVNIIVQGGNTDDETVFNIKDALEDFFADLMRTNPQPREG